MSISAVQPNFGAAQPAAANKVKNNTNPAQKTEDCSNNYLYGLGGAALGAAVTGGIMYYRAKKGKAPEAEKLVENMSNITRSIVEGAPTSKAVKESHAKFIEKSKAVQDAIDTNPTIKNLQTEVKTSNKTLKDFEKQIDAKSKTQAELENAVNEHGSNEVKEAYKALTDAKTAVEGKEGEELVKAQEALTNAKNDFQGKITADETFKPIVEAEAKATTAEAELSAAIGDKKLDEKLAELTESVTTKQKAFDDAVAGDEKLSALVKEKNEAKTESQKLAKHFIAAKRAEKVQEYLKSQKPEA